jgi:hypothetical protein
LDFDSIIFFYYFFPNKFCLNFNYTDCNTQLLLYKFNTCNILYQISSEVNFLNFQFTTVFLCTLKYYAKNNYRRKCLLSYGLNSQICDLLNASQCFICTYDFQFVQRLQLLEFLNLHSTSCEVKLDIGSSKQVFFSIL